MELNILAVSSEGAKRIEADPTLLETIWFEGDDALIDELGALVCSADYGSVAEAMEAMHEATGDGSEEPELEPSRDIDYDQGYGPAGLIDPAHRKRLKNDTWSMVAAMDEDADELLTDAYKKKLAVFFLVS